MRIIDTSIPFLKYLVKRLLLMIPVIIIISLLIFFMIQNMPGNELNMFFNPEDPSLTELQKQMLTEYWTEKLGLNDPFFVKWGKWWLNMFQGDFGISITKQKPVADFVGEAIMNSFRLNISGFILAFLISIVVGVKSAVKRFSKFDNFWTVFSIIGISLPGFFMSILLVFAFSVNLGWTPISGMQDPMNETPAILYYILPVTVITLSSLASLIRYVRNAMLEVLKQDYIRTARSKGLKEKVVIYRHAFRNALIPVITLVGFYIPLLFGGSIVLERIFVWPGIGLLMNAAYTGRDRALMITMLIFYSFLTLLGNLFMDIGYALADPRVREGGER
ncbi:ABC transporter permease [Mycoplasmatota bacterium]|nr:ABC transporter permease [Mycoplasmatota bacterium]